MFQYYRVNALGCEEEEFKKLIAESDSSTLLCMLWGGREELMWSVRKYHCWYFSFTVGVIWASYAHRRCNGAVHLMISFVSNVFFWVIIQYSYEKDKQCYNNLTKISIVWKKNKSWVVQTDAPQDIENVSPSSIH